MTARIRLVLMGFALVTTLVVAGVAGAGKGGPSPGVEFGGPGIANTSGTLRYVASFKAGNTLVRAFDADGVVRRGTVAGVLGIPRVAFDGSLDGLAHDGRSLVLASPDKVEGNSRFAVFSTRNLELRRMITMRGSWSFDALSPDGRKLYLVEYASTGRPTYRVRAYDLIRGTLLREAVIDPRRGGRAMTGLPVTRAFGPGAVWAYTLYQKPGGFPFVHALDTMRGKALCIELPWKGNQSRLFDVRMSVQVRSLVLRGLGGAHLATIDRSEFVVHSHSNPLQVAS